VEQVSFEFEVKEFWTKTVKNNINDDTWLTTELAMCFQTTPR